MKTTPKKKTTRPSHTAEERRDIETQRRYRTSLRRVKDIEALGKKLRRAYRAADAVLLDLARDVAVAQGWEFEKKEPRTSAGEA